CSGRRLRAPGWAAGSSARGAWSRARSPRGARWSGASPRALLRSAIGSRSGPPEAAFGTDDRQFLLRNERSGTGRGRIYTITYSATDASGNTTLRQTTVTVPRRPNERGDGGGTPPPPSSRRFEVPAAPRALRPQPTAVMPPERAPAAA